MKNIEVLTFHFPCLCGLCSRSKQLKVKRRPHSFIHSLSEKPSDWTLFRTTYCVGSVISRWLGKTSLRSFPAGPDRAAEIGPHSVFMRKGEGRGGVGINFLSFLEEKFTFGSGFCNFSHIKLLSSSRKAVARSSQFLVVVKVKWLQSSFPGLPHPRRPRLPKTSQAWNVIAQQWLWLWDKQ